MLRLPVKKSEISYFLGRKGYTTGTLANNVWKYMKARNVLNKTYSWLLNRAATQSGSSTGNVKDRCRHFFRTLNDL